MDISEHFSNGGKPGDPDQSAYQYMLADNGGGDIIPVRLKTHQGGALLSRAEIPGAGGLFFDYTSEWHRLTCSLPHDRLKAVSEADFHAAVPDFLARWAQTIPLCAPANGFAS